MVDLFNTVKQHPEYFKQLKCKEMLFTQYDCAQIKPMQDLFSEHNYIAYVISGKRVFHLPGEKHVMTEGKCVFAKKGAWIAEKDPGEGWCVLVFFIPDQYLKDFFISVRQRFSAGRKNATGAPQQIIDLRVNDLTKSFFASMIPYFESPPGEELIELKFKELLLHLIANHDNGLFLHWLNTLANGKVTLFSAMEANYMYNLSLSDYARIAGRSLTSFKREFETLYHMTPGRWLTQRRLEYGKVLLETTDKSIGEVTFECGFENPTHFSRQFKEKFGHSPSSLRKPTQSEVDV